MLTRLAAIFALTLSSLLIPAPTLSAQTSLDVVPLVVLQAGFRGQFVGRSFAIGKVLHTADGGQVFGFDLNHNGNDGVLGSAKTVTAQGQVVASVETFDQTTAKITKIVVATNTMDDWVVEGIVGNDVGLVLHDHVVNNRDFRGYRTMNPVTLKKFTGFWTPPNPNNFLIQQVAANQAISTTAVLGFDFSDTPLVFATNVAANTLGPVFHLDPNHFSGGDGPQLAQDTLRNLAVLATSPDAGAVGGKPPLIATVNLTTGRLHQFNGIKIPPFNSGFVNGLAVDSATHIACTTTELDADVEFYDYLAGTGTAVGLPGAFGNQFFSGSAVVGDAIHKLFLVVQANGSIGPRGDSVIDIFDESGNLVESITGFKAFSVTPGIAINPVKRLGFIMGPTPDALTQFTY
ncbi:MAG TPA: hypothetical protein VGW96_06815 [Candidatus Eremiobacteraceae bacterium]|nr:hypothetical protein [Candidatus Eremiobacteraceae bacterium]